MAQPSIAEYFNTRKRAGADDVNSIKNRRLLDDTEKNKPNATITSQKDISTEPQEEQNEITSLKKTGVRTRSGRTSNVKRIGVQDPSQISGSGISPKKISKIEENIKEQKLVPFIQKGLLSPRKKSTPKSSARQKLNEKPPSVTLITAFASKNSANNVEKLMTTPTKQIIKGSNNPLKQSELKSLVKKELNFDEVKTKISRSAKLQELKASLARIKEIEKTRKAQEERNRKRKEDFLSPAKKTTVVQLKEFDKIELEVLTSPKKTFKTPTKLPPKTPDKNELMSPRHTDISKRVLFGPAELGSPSKMVVQPEYQRFMSLAEKSSKAGQLPLPYKYRHLIEIFKAVDSVCAMFFNRKECITFKKLKPAVQRMMRKNFFESHLAQIKHLYSEAFLFTQMKMRNYGSTSKADYFQLVITPNVENLPEKLKLNKIDEDDILSAAQSTAMNPHVMTQRLQKFQNALLEKVKTEHDTFLKSLDPPLSIPKEKVTRWHPDFDLENCPEIELGNLPQPPNVEKYSSAKDILSTARNLFNCSTTMERVMERYEAKLEADKVKTENIKNTECNTKHENISNTTTTTTPAAKIATIDASSSTKSSVETDMTSTLLKGVPKSLLEKIRAKQAAKALDAMTRRPSQDQEATKYSRLPELARHLRNVFITERKGVLIQEIIIKKIQNSFRTCLTSQEIENHLQLLAKEAPTWLSFHEVRKTMYLKINRDMDLSKIIEHLEKVANEKSKM